MVNIRSNIIVDLVSVEEIALQNSFATTVV